MHLNCKFDYRIQLIASTLVQRQRVLKNRDLSVRVTLERSGRQEPGRSIF